MKTIKKYILYILVVSLVIILMILLLNIKITPINIINITTYIKNNKIDFLTYTVLSAGSFFILTEIYLILLNYFLRHNKSNKTVSLAISYLYCELNRKSILKMVFVVISMIFIGFLINYPSIILGELVDNIVNNKKQGINYAMNYILSIGGLFLLAEIITIARKYIVERIATNLERDQYVKIVLQLMNADTRALQKYRMGGLNVKIHRSIEGVTKLLKISFLDFFPVVATSLIAFLMASRNIYIPSVMLTVLVLSIWITKSQIRSQDGIRRNLFRSKENIGAEISEKLSNIEYVKSTGNIEHESKLMGKLALDLAKTEFIHHKYMMSYDFVKNLIEVLGFIAVIMISIGLAKSGGIQAGEILTFALLYKSFSSPLKELHKVLDEGYEACMTVEDLITLHDIKQSKQNTGKINILQETLAEKEIINVKNLSVIYKEENGNDSNILSEISLSINAGEIIGFAGESGSGKSTFIKTIVGLVDGYDGHITLFGKPSNEINKHSLAQQMTYIPQASPIFSGSVRDNILYATPNTKDKDINDAMVKSGFDKVMENLEGHLNAPLVEGGKNLSGGEKQRLLLTTVFTKKPRLVILDEATSALDSITQDFVHKSLLNMHREEKSTLLIIAHRLRMLKEVDRIYVFKNGKIVGTGTYSELNNSNSYFRELVKKEEVE